MELSRCVSRISNFYPCRTQQITELYECIGKPDEQFPQAVYVYGQACTGKTQILQSLLRNAKVDYAIVNCTECFSPKILYENIVDNLNNHNLSAENGFNCFTKCDSMGDLILQLRTLPVANNNIVLVFENADYLRDLNPNILTALMRLQELSGRNVCSVLVSQLPYEKFYPKTGIPEIVRIRFPQYTANEVAKILQKDYANVKVFVRRGIAKRVKVSEEEKTRWSEILESLDVEFYANYLHAFLCVFFRACRNVSQLRLVAKECFAKYCEPIFEDPAAQKSVTKLWHHVSDTLKEALANIYSRIESASEANRKAESAVKQVLQVLELPFYAKYLLVAGFLSSHNPASQDKRLFVKNHGKQRKRMQAVNAKAKLGEQTSLQQGPKSFTIDRLLAIFHAILDQKVTLTCNLMAQIASLVQLDFFVYVANETNVMEGSARLQCFLSYEFATQIGEMVGFNVRQYLFDLI